MKKFTSFIGRAKQLVFSREYLVYTVAFLALMSAVYFFLVFAGMAEAPKFTYAEF